MGNTKVYISSTYNDLKEYREQVYQALRELRYDVIAMEDYVATDERPLDKCLADVAGCDVYVGIFAWRYGYIPPGQERSITELEYRQAGEVGLERIICLVVKDAPWSPDFMDHVTGEGECGQRIKSLRDELGESHIANLFKTPEELARQVAASVTLWEKKRLDASMDLERARQAQETERRRTLRGKQKVVNVRPLDVTHTFKDRVREMQALCDHLTDASVRLITVVGRGGMGKTALVSRVLADLERGVLPVDDKDKELSVDGILYLSAQRTGLSLERLYADVGRMLGEPAASDLSALWADRRLSLEAKVEGLLEALRDGLYVILLDNLEDGLTEECEIAEEGPRLFVERCLTGPGGARLIATSRDEVKLADAALHNGRCIPLREGLPEDDAVALLRDLDSDPEVPLGLCDATEGELRRAARMTRRIPRALESIAGILREDPATDLPGLLDDPDLFGEHVVEKLVKEGYKRLGEDERWIMEALAVFNRPVSDTAVTFLLQPWFPGLDVPAVLRRLCKGYFVTASRITGEYQLHPLDHAYAYRHISQEPGDAYTLRNLELRAAEYYRELRKPQAEWKSIEDLAPQLAEFEHRVQAGDHGEAYRVLDPIDFDYLLLWGYAARLMEMREKLSGHLAEPKMNAANLGSLGLACHVQGRSGGPSSS